MLLAGTFMCRFAARAGESRSRQMLADGFTPPVATAGGETNLTAGEDANGISRGDAIILNASRRIYSAAGHRGKIIFTAGDAVERRGRATAPYSRRLAGGNVGKGIRKLRDGRLARRLIPPASRDMVSRVVEMLGLVWSRQIKFCCPNVMVKGAVAERETRRSKRGSMPAHLSTFYFPPSAGAAGPPAIRSGIKAESIFTAT